MKSALRSALKTLVPARIRRLARALFGWQWFKGNYPTWAAARAVCSGYDAAVIVERVLAATQAVRAGRAAFERDSVLFPEPVPEPGVFDALASIAATVHGRPVRVLDFGGSLGTTYWRHRDDLRRFADWEWDIVEQSGFVAAGREHIDDAHVRFFATIAQAQVAGSHDVLLASCVLQYLENPDQALWEWWDSGIRWVLLTNLPLHARGPDRIAVQRVPPSIYPATYPVRFFNRDEFMRRVGQWYTIERQFASEAVWPVGLRQYPSTGLLLRRRDAAVDAAKGSA